VKTSIQNQPCIIVFIDEERLDHNEDLVHVGPDEVVQLVENPIDDFDHQVALLN
jgi:hypothetical protein